MASNEIADELRRTLRQIGPATFGEVASDVRGRVRLGLLLLVSIPAGSDLDLAMVVAWDALRDAGAIEAVDGGRFAWRPLVGIATGAKQTRLFA